MFIMVEMAAKPYAEAIGASDLRDRLFHDEMIKRAA
jgi:hypothetical protein